MQNSRVLLSTKDSDGAIELDATTPGPTELSAGCRRRNLLRATGAYGRPNSRPLLCYSEMLDVSHP
jgi:hypothetical protein